MTEPNDVDALDAEFDEALSRRASGSTVLNGSSLIEALATLDDLEWPDRDLGSRIYAGLAPAQDPTDVGDSVDPVPGQSAGHRRRRTTRAAAFGAVGIAATLVVVLTLVISPPPGQEQAVHAGTWRLVGYFSPPGWKQSGLSGPAGPLTCPTARTCYLVSAEQLAATSPQFTLAALSVSHDHGATWSDLPLKGLSSFTTGLQCPLGNAAVCFAGALEGTTPVLISTADGGTTWTDHPLPGNGQLVSLACTSRRHCVGVARTDTRSRTGSLYITNDAGKQWSMTGSAQGPITNVVCTRSTCVAVGTEVVRKHGPQAIGLVFSHDGGTSWSPATIPNQVEVAPSYLSPGQLSCPTRRVCWALGFNDSPSEVVAPPVVIRSTDGGEHWVLRHTPPNQPLAISCPTANDCWIGGGATTNGQPEVGGFVGNYNGTISPRGNAAPAFWHTTDAGRTWHQTTITPPKVAPDGVAPDSLQEIAQISCPTRPVCIALGEGDPGALGRYTATYTNAPAKPRQ